MRLDKNDHDNPLKSDGKKLIITPIITLNGGATVLYLAPITYTLPNWMVGFDERPVMQEQVKYGMEHFWFHTYGADSADLSFNVRLIEDHPDMIPDDLSGHYAVNRVRTAPCSGGAGKSISEYCDCGHMYLIHDVDHECPICPPEQKS